MNIANIEIRPVKTKEDYDAALNTIEKLWDSPAGSAESEALEILAILVDEYENKHFPI